MDKKLITSLCVAACDMEGEQQHVYIIFYIQDRATGLCLFCFLGSV